MRRVGTEERGVTAVIVAICATVLFGIGALVVDVGAGFQEKRELQNGADAAALALAQDCALGNCNNLNTKAVEYANLNAKDGASRATANTIAGHGVKVVTRTNDAGPNSDGDVNTVDFQLAPVFGGPRGGEVAATATARWAPPAGGSTFPLTFSLCEFNKLVVGGVFSPTPQVIYFHEINSGNAAADPCAAQAGQDYDGDTKLNGGFGWLENGPNPPPPATVSRRYKLFALPAIKRRKSRDGTGKAMMRWSMSSKSIRTGSGDFGAFGFAVAAVTASPSAIFSSSLSGPSGEGESLRNTMAYTLRVGLNGYADISRKPSVGPIFVLAVKYKYLPPLSKVG